MSRDRPWEQLVLFLQPQVGLGDALLRLCLKQDQIPRIQSLSLNEGDWKSN